MFVPNIRWLSFQSPPKNPNLSKEKTGKIQDINKLKNPKNLSLKRKK